MTISFSLSTSVCLDGSYSVVCNIVVDTNLVANTAGKAGRRLSFLYILDEGSNTLQSRQTRLYTGLQPPVCIQFLRQHKTLFLLPSIDCIALFICSTDGQLVFINIADIPRTLLQAR